MADLEIRAFGKRFLVIFDQHKPAEQPQPDNLSGDFSPAEDGEFSDDEVMVRGFGFGWK